MKLRFIRQGVWWLTSKLEDGKLSQFSFVIPMVLQWLKDQTKERKEK